MNHASTPLAEPSGVCLHLPISKPGRGTPWALGHVTEKRRQRGLGYFVALTACRECGVVFAAVWAQRPDTPRNATVEARIGNFVGTYRGDADLWEDDV